MINETSVISCRGPASQNLAKVDQLTPDYCKRKDNENATQVPCRLGGRPAGARRTGIGRRQDPDRIRLGGRSAGPPSLLFAKYHQAPPAANQLRLHRQWRQRRGQGRPERQGASSPGRLACRCPSDAGTTYIKMYLDGLCIDVNRANHLQEHLDPASCGTLTGLTTNWNADAGLQPLPRRSTRFGRDTNGGTYNFFLQAVLNNQLPSGQRQRADRRRPRWINAVKQDAQRVGYAGLAWQGSTKLHLHQGQRGALRTEARWRRPEVPADPGTSSWSSRQPTRTRTLLKFDAVGAFAARRPGR